MIGHHSPATAYRRVDFEARVAGARPEELVLVCYEQAIDALGAALSAARAGDNPRKSEALTRALAALTALQLGVDEGNPVAPAVSQWLNASRSRILDSVLSFDEAGLTELRDDLGEIAGAFARVR